MPRRRSTLALSLAVALGLAHAAWGQAPNARTVILPGLSYRVLGSGPAGGAHPTRADTVTMRYVGRLESGEVFSTSRGDGSGTSSFAVNGVIPGMSAALQLMRVGDRWRITMPPYLAYGPGRPFQPAATGSQAQAIQKRSIPPDATLIFDVELVAIAPAKAP